MTSLIYYLFSIISNKLTFINLTRILACVFFQSLMKILLIGLIIRSFQYRSYLFVPIFQLLLAVLNIFLLLLVLLILSWILGIGLLMYNRDMLESV